MRHFALWVFVNKLDENYVKNGKKTVKLCIFSWRGGEQAYMRKEADYSK